MPEDNVSTSNLKELPKLVEELLGKTTGGQSGTDDSNKTPEQKLKELGFDDTSIEKIRSLGGLLIDDVSKLPKHLKDRVDEEIKKNQNTTKDQLYQTIEHLKTKNNEILAELERKKKLEKEENKKKQDEAEKLRLEKLSADEKIAELKKQMESAFNAIKENTERENRELKAQIHIRDMEKLRDTLIANEDIIVELVPKITAETTEESLKAAVDHAKAVTEQYRQKYGAASNSQNGTSNNGSVNNNGAGGNNGNVLPNNRGGRNSVDYKELETLMSDINKISDVKELERRMARISALQGVA